MNITEIKTITLPLSSLHENTGQIEGVHANPRVLRDEKYRALVKSLKEDNLTGVLPLKIYDNGGEWVVLGGNMRLKALQEIGAKECACIVIPSDTPAETLNKIVIVDNSTFGEWDMDMLANEWDAAALKDWGVDVPRVIADEEPPTDLDAEQKNKPFIAKITFENAGLLQKFIDDNKGLIEEYGGTISVSGGEL